jgi:hypothetical protein
MCGAAGKKRARAFTHTFPVLMLLLGLAFMHGACAGTAAGIAPDGGAESTWSAAPKVAERAEAGPYHGHHDPDHAPCCHLAAGDDCVAVLVVSFLLLLVLGLGGPAIRFDVSRGLLWATPGLRAGPPGGMPRLALCVIRI